MNYEASAADPQHDLKSMKLKLKEALYQVYLDVDSLTELENAELIEPHAVIITNFREKNKYCCDFCDTDFVTLADLSEHNDLEHPAIVHSDARRCYVCEVNFRNWESRNSHMRKKHYDTYIHESQRYLDDLICCSWCRNHFKDLDEWKSHWTTYHNKKFYPNASWMNVPCDKKGMNIVSVGVCEVYCILCSTSFSLDCNTSRFETTHGKSPIHKNAVKQYIVKHDQIPDKFLQVVDMHGFQVPGKFHPHEIQSSCCCRIYNCQFCTRHQSLMTKFRQNAIVLCTICNKNIQWVQEDVDSPAEHIMSAYHQQRLKEYMMQHGYQPEFMDIFKDVGHVIPTVSRK